MRSASLPRGDAGPPASLPAARLPLPAGEAHLHFVVPEEVREPHLLRRYEALLAPAERERRRRFVFAQHRHEYLVTRALVRTTLSRYADLAPQDWAFRTNAYGCPEVDRGRMAAGVPPLRFNLSHTDGMVACLVALGRDVGVDVEPLGRACETLGIAGRYFAPSELDALRALPPAEQRVRFLEYWTLKEAYIKARGMGLSLPLDRFSFVLEPPARPRIRFEPGMGDDAARWQFEQLRPTPRHLVAAAVRRTAGEDLRLRTWRVVP